MQIFHGIENIEFDANTILTVGSFDGLHSGHQSILKRLRHLAENENCRDLLITFDPHPQIVLKNRKPIKLLTGLKERLEIAEKSGLNNVLVLNFTKEFAELSHIDFIELLYTKVGIKKILIGHDHSFGKNREGDLNFLNSVKDKYNFEVEQIDAHIESDLIISSTKIRNALIEDNLELANNLLGYKYFLNGKVVHGDKRGRTIGFPTANIEAIEEHKLIPANGVYAVGVKISDQKYLSTFSQQESFTYRKFYGMCNIGTRPTFENNNITKIEVNIFDFNEDIYDFIVEICFLKKIRNEQKFDGIEQIITQLEKDKVNTLKIIELLDI